jgi:hypothetical protein
MQCYGVICVCKEHDLCHKLPWAALTDTYFTPYFQQFRLTLQTLKGDYLRHVHQTTILCGKSFSLPQVHFYASRQSVYGPAALSVALRTPSLWLILKFPPVHVR